MTLHLGPAGSTYPNLIASGDANRKQHCNDFPVSAESAIIPQLMLSKHPEKRDPTTGEVEVSNRLKGTKPVIGLLGRVKGRFVFLCFTFVILPALSIGLREQQMLGGNIDLACFV